MLGLNYLLTIGISVTLVVNEVTATVAYIYRRDNGGHAKVLQVGANQAQYVPQRLQQQWNANGFESHNIRDKVSDAVKPIVEEADTDIPNSAKVKVSKYHKLHPQQFKPPLKEAHVTRNTKYINQQYENQNAARINQLGLHQRPFALHIAQPSKMKLIKLQSTYQKPNKAHIITKPVSKGKRNEDGKDIEQSAKKYVEIKDLVIREYDGDVKGKTNPIQNDKETEHHEEKKLYDSNKEPRQKENTKSGKNNRTFYNTHGHKSRKNYNVDKRNPHEKTKHKETKQKEDNHKQSRKDHSERPSSFGTKYYYDDKTVPYYNKAEDYFGSNNYYDYDKTGLKDDFSKHNFAKGDFGFGKEDFGLIFNENDENKDFEKYVKKEESGSKKDGKQSKSKAKKGKKKFYVVKQYTTGYHNKWNKDEYKKDHDFYDDADKSGYTRNGGSEEEHHGSKKGGHSHEEEGASASDKDHYGSAKADKEKDIHDASHHRYSNRKGDETEYKDNNKFDRKKGDSHGKEYAYDEEEDKE